MNKFFTTTPIYYVNDVPHIGAAYTTVAADIITRYYKQRGYDSRLLTGTDEHGAKISEAAQKHNQQPKEYADQISAEFKKAWDSLNINYSRFIRTTDEDHIKIAQEFLQKLYDSGAIDPKPRLYTGLYCVGHEKFMSEEELVDGVCPDHKTKPIEQSEENYYFKLGQFKDQITNLLKSDQLKIRPESRKNEILGKLEQGLEDISISRANLDWGIPLPFDKNHTAYVWIEALINYYTYGSQEDLWPADLHLIGKDILWFHTVIWPAMLLAIGENTPKEVFAHGFFTINGQKMSKTLGNVISPQQLIDRYGVEGTRYVLLSAFPFGEDGDFSFEKLDAIYNADLANNLGNNISRVAKLCELAEYYADSTVETDILGSHELENLNFQQYIHEINNFISGIDQAINLLKPWEHTNDKEWLTNWCKSAVREIIRIATSLKPLLPETAEKILQQFSGEVKSSAPLFPRIS